MPKNTDAKQKKRASQPADDAEFDAALASQQSSGSDDAAMMALIAQQMQAAQQKKNKDKDAKFVQVVKIECRKLIQTRMHELEGLKRNISDDLDNFLRDDAEVVDTIRKKWEDIRKAEAALRDIVHAKGARCVDLDNDREQQSVEQLARVKSAFQNENRMILSLDPAV